MPLVQYGMKTNSAYPGLLTKNGHARLCVILSTSSGIEISVNEKISRSGHILPSREAPEETPRRHQSPDVPRPSLMSEYLRCGPSRRTPR